MDTSKKWTRRLRKMKLYEINEGLRALLSGDIDELVDTETGEVFRKESIDNLVLARDEKVEGCAVVYKELLAEAAAVKSEMERLKERKEAIERRAEGLKDYVAGVLAGEKFASAKVKISWRKSESVQVDCEPTALPELYQNVKVSVTADKTKLKADLKAGAIIDGVSLVQNNSMSIK
jgi:hypothetical protein